MGTGFLREDWISVAFARNCGGMDCLAISFRDRPVMEALFRVFFLAFHNHPGAFYWVLNGLLALCAAAVFRFLKPLTNSTIAICVPLIWAIAPSHLALQHWASAIQLNIALLLLILGCARLRERGDWFAIVLLVCSVATYEATLPIALLAIFAIPRLQRAENISVRRSFIAGAAATAVGALVFIDQSRHNRALEWVDPSMAIWANVSFNSTSSLATAPAAVILLGLLGAIIRVVKRQPDQAVGTAEGLILGGLAVAVLGSVPFMTTGYDITFHGIGDRATMISSLGIAAIFAGTFWLAGQLLNQSNLTLVIATAAFAALALPVHVSRDSDFSTVHKQTRESTNILERNPRRPLPTPSDDVLNDYARVNVRYQLEVQLSRDANLPYLVRLPL